MSAPGQPSRNGHDDPQEPFPMDDRSISAKIRLAAAAKDYTTDSGDTVHALAPTDLEIREGEFVCIVGPSGCGKSTLMDMIAGFHSPSSGVVAVDGEPVTGPSAARAAPSAGRAHPRRQARPCGVAARIARGCCL